MLLVVVLVVVLVGAVCGWAAQIHNEKNNDSLDVIGKPSHTWNVNLSKPVCSSNGASLSFMTDS